MAVEILHESYEILLGLKHTTPGSAVRSAADCAMEPGYFVLTKR